MVNIKKKIKKIQKCVSICTFKYCAEGFKVFFLQARKYFFAKWLVFTSYVALGVPIVLLLTSLLIVILYYHGLGCNDGFIWSVLACDNIDGIVWLCIIWDFIIRCWMFLDSVGWNFMVMKCIYSITLYNMILQSNASCWILENICM